MAVIPGFQGVSKSGDITSIGRGGSDATAVAIAKIFKTDSCEIYTDVDGVYSSDPNKIPVAKKIDKIGYTPIDRAIEKMSARRKEGRSEKDHLKLTKEIQLKNFSFYRDYLTSIQNISSMVNPGGYVCFILGNRISGGQEMRLDLFTDWAFRQNGFKKVGKTKSNFPESFSSIFNNIYIE